MFVVRHWLALPEVRTFPFSCPASWSSLPSQFSPVHGDPYHRSMNLDLSDDEAAALIKELRTTIDNGSDPFSERIGTLKAILVKLKPEPITAGTRRCWGERSVFPVCAI
jgi:hypothetical protein